MSRTSILIFDGDCGFCTTSAGWARRIDAAATVVPYQQVDLDAMGLTVYQARSAIRWADGSGRVEGGAAAVAAFLAAARWPWRALGLLLALPVVDRIAAAVYRLVARNRFRLPGGTPACAVGSARPADQPSDGAPPRSV